MICHLLFLCLQSSKNTLVICAKFVLHLLLLASCHLRLDGEFFFAWQCYLNMHLFHTRLEIAHNSKFTISSLCRSRYGWRYPDPWGSQQSIPLNKHSCWFLLQQQHRHSHSPPFLRLLFVPKCTNKTVTEQIRCNIRTLTDMKIKALWL
jgi:hypothetical protein